MDSLEPLLGRSPWIEPDTPTEKMPATLTEPNVLVLLSERRRRILLRVLQESNAPLTTDDLASRVARRESVGQSQVGRRAVRRSLEQCHLPRLSRTDVIVYDEGEETVAPGTNFYCLVQTLETTTEQELPWSDA